MALRLLEYNVLVDRKHDCPVISCVIYLHKDHPIVESPLIRNLQSGQPIYQFHFLVIKIWEMSADDLMQAHLPGILALLPLTKNGREREVIEEMITQLQAHQKEEVLLVRILTGLSDLERGGGTAMSQEEVQDVVRGVTRVMGLQGDLARR
ncbi:MAG: hypothetical protein M3Z08_16185 [Chloroflexota bacterium]|nr:hypothetical protein [Chloroflexota bacterium]